MHTLKLKWKTQENRILTSNKGNTSPTVKLENLFTIVDTEIAADRGPYEKISATINQGIDPGVRIRYYFIKKWLQYYSLSSSIIKQTDIKFFNMTLPQKDISVWFNFKLINIYAKYDKKWGKMKKNKKIKHQSTLCKE